MLTFLRFSASAFGVLMMGMFGFTSDARALTNYNFCFTTQANYIDNAIPDAGANHVPVWTTDTDRPLNGAVVVLDWYANSSCTGTYTQPFYANVDINGCTGNVAVSTSTGCFRYSVFMNGTPVNGGGNYLNVYGSTGALSILQSTFVGGGGVKNIEFADSDKGRVYAALAFSIREFTAQLSGERFNVFLTDSQAVCGCGTAGATGDRSCLVNGYSHICLTPAGRKRVFTMAHEYGHGVLRVVGGHPTADCSNEGSGHSLTSIEFQSCAMSEGFASFVAADVWNGETGIANPDAYVGFENVICGGTEIEAGQTTVLGAEAGTGGCDVRFLETVLDSTAPWPGVANEIDWLRAFWDFHTNADGIGGAEGNPVTHTEIVDGMISAGFTSDRLRTHDEVRQGFADGDCRLYRRIVWAAAANGCDHCKNDGAGNQCVDVAGCTDVD